MGVNVRNRLAVVSVMGMLVTAFVWVASVPIHFQSPQYLVANVTNSQYSPLLKEPTLEHWLPDWYNQSDIGLVLDERVREIRKRCKSYNGSKNEWKDSPMIRNARSKNLVYCHTAKAGSTFWRSLLNRAKSEQVKQGQGQGHAMKMTTMRNPWHRLVSTYIQKFETKNGKFLDMEIKKFCWKLPTKKKPSFIEFVKKCVIRPWKNNKYNIHWLPTTERCDVCGDNFDYIVAVENMALESNYVLEKAGLENPEQIFNNTRSDTIRSNEKHKKSAGYQSYYIDMDVEDIKALQQIYAFDIYVLQYPKTPFVDFENS